MNALQAAVSQAGGRVLDATPETFIVEITGNEGEINAFIVEIATHGELTEVVRSGALGLTRDSRTLRVRQ